MRYSIDDYILVKGKIVGLQKSKDYNGIEYLQYIIEISEADVKFTDRVIYLTEGQIHDKTN